MATITLAKALKLKNRQVQKVKSIQERIEASNSHLAGSPPDFDARVLYQELKAETARLWGIKQTINAANAPVHAAIYELAETKGLIAFLKGLNTKRGLTLADTYGFGGAGPQEYEAQISAVDAAVEIEALEGRIDDLQDSLDAHNATTRVEIEE